MGDGTVDDVTAGWAPSATAGAAELEQARALVAELASSPTVAAIAVPRAMSPALDRARGAAVTMTTGRAPERSMGPFVDRIGRPVWMDVFPFVETVAVVRSADLPPLLVVTIPIGLPPSDTVRLGRGTIWCAAQAFTPAAPAGWCGLRIAGGAIRFGSTVSPGASPIVVGPFATVTVELTLDPPVAPSGTGPGADARQADVALPSTAVFEFRPGGAAVTHAGSASATVYGQSMQFTLAPGAPVYDTVLGRVDIPLAVDPMTFRASECLSSLVTVAGEASLTSAAWSLPITLGTPSTLGAAAGDGGFAIGVGTGIGVAWDGGRRVATAPAAVVLVEPGAIAVELPAGRTASGPETIVLWDTATPRSLHGRLDVRFAKPFPLHYVSEAQGVEALVFVTTLSARLDPPRTINDELIVTDTDAAILAFIDSGTGVFALVEAVMPAGEGNGQAVAVKNAVFLTRGPLELAVFGKYTAGRVAPAVLVLEFLMGMVVPTLPDPYAGNFPPDQRGVANVASGGRLTVLLEWQPDQAPRLDIILPAAGTGQQRPSLAPAAAPGGPALRAVAVDPDGPALAALEQRFARVGGAGATQFALLDLSTNVSQFGVAYAPAEGSAVAVADLFIEASGSGVRVWTLPAVQWEPVVTLPGDDPQDPSFPSPLTFGDCGGPTELATQTVALVPIAPRPAIDAMVAGYNHIVDSTPVAVRFTLPFGIAAVAELHRSVLLELPSPTFSDVRPPFGADGLTGGDQLSFGAAALFRFGGDHESPSLPGAAWQRHNARFNGMPTTDTVLTPIDDTFNSNFGPATKSPRVPVTRLDISGFGETLFSDWRNPTDAAAIISKAQFDVVVGRTSFEVVQARSVLYPYGVRVVRTITLERQNGGVVTRKDSGWKAVTDGTYRFPKPDLITHPGVVRSVSGVVNIRDTGDRHTTPDGSELMAVYFDCVAQIEGVVAGAGPDGVPSSGQRGYVQLTDPPAQGQLAPDQYAELLTAVGPLGGPVDCIVDIGGSGQRMRVRRVDVAATPGMGGPEFAISAWGSPVLPGGGQWSFARQTAPGDAPQPVDTDRGVPLIRAGPAPAPPPVSNPYRFADPADLLVPTSPASDYGVLHATGTQRTFFPRPKIEAGGSPAITSTRPPVLADPYVLSTAIGLFPRVDACLSFPDANYSLAIGAGGNLTLQLPTPSFTVPPTQRVLIDANAVRSVVHFADEANNPSVVTPVIDTAAAVPWSLTITNLSHANETAKMGEVFRTVGTLTASAAAPVTMQDSRLVFGPPLKPVQSLVSFLEVFGPLPPVNVGMTNDWTLQVGLKVDFKKFLESYAPPTKAFLEEFIEDLDLVLSDKESAAGSSCVIQFELTVKFPTPFKPIVGIGLAKIQLLMATDVGTAWTIQIGFGAGISQNIGIGELTAYFAETEFLIVGDTVFGLGAGMLLKGTIDLEIVEVDVSIEAKVALLSVSCNNGNDTTIWGAAQVTIALEITIAWVIDIEVDYQTEWDENLDGGPCPLPDVL